MLCHHPVTCKYTSRDRKAHHGVLPPKTPEWPVEVAYDDLPAWMQSARHTLDWPLVGVALLVVALIAPLIADPLPWNAGLRSEVARALEMSESIQTGILYPRWAPDFTLGYGSPLWNFLPPLPHYLAGLHRVLAQTSAEFSVKVTLIGATILLPIALFGFARRRWGVCGGLLAVALGLFSPQIALVKPLIEGNLGALLAAGVWLLSLWALDRLLAYGRGANLLLAAGACAAVWLAHEPLNILFSALTLVWLLFRLASGQPGDAIRAGLLAVALGFAASAFYWLPAWTERDAITWQPAAGAERIAPGGVPADDLFGWFPAIDRAAVNPQPAPVLGVALWGSAAIALLVITVTWRRTRRIDPPDREALFFGVSGVLLVGAALQPFGDAWAGASGWPPFAPADLAFPAALCLALFGASLGHRLEFHCAPRWAAVGMIALAAAIGISGAPALVIPQPPTSATELTLAGLVESEVRGVPLAGHTPGWLLPRGMQAPSTSDVSLAASYDSARVDKVIRDGLPATTLADTIEHTAHSERIMVRSAGDAEITLRTFLFDGWRAELDGQPLALHATERGGLIALRVPEGQHELVVTFGSTRPRTTGWVLSGVACLLLLGLAVRQEHHPLRAIEVHPAATVSPSRRTQAAPGVVVGAVIILLAVALAARLTPDASASASPPGTVAQASAPLFRRFQGGLDLLAYDLTTPAEPDTPLALTLYWRGWRPDLPDYQVDLQWVSVDDPSQTYPLGQRRHPGQLPTSEWPRWPLLEHYVVDSYTLAMPDDVPPGDYRIAVQIGRCSHLDPAPCPAITPVFVQADDDASLEQSVTLPDILTVAG